METYRGTGRQRGLLVRRRRRLGDAEVERGLLVRRRARRAAAAEPDPGQDDQVLAPTRSARRRQLASSPALCAARTAARGRVCSGLRGCRCWAGPSSSGERSGGRGATGDRRGDGCGGFTPRGGDGTCAPVFLALADTLHKGLDLESAPHALPRPPLPSRQEGGGGGDGARAPLCAALPVQAQAQS